MSTLSTKKNLLKAMDAVNAKFGAGTMAIASEVAFAHVRRIPTGIFKLDMDTGGGLPKGRITMIVGDESSGKSTICTLVAANAQQTCRQCMGPFKWVKQGADAVVVTTCGCGANEPHTVAYFDIEGTFDPEWAESLGLIVSEVILVQPEYAEQGADQIVALLRTGELDLLALDSIAMMQPAAEITKSAEDATVGMQAKIVNRAMRNIQSAFNSLGMNNPHKPAVLQVNQFREKVGVMYGDPRTWPGGRGQNYAASILITTRAGKRIDGKGKVGGTDDTKVGVEMHYKTEKNKTFTPFKSGTYCLYNADAPQLGVKKGHINNFEQMVEWGDGLGLLGKGGAWYDLTKTFGETFRNPESNNGKFQGKDAVIAFLTADDTRARTVRERILQEVKSHPGSTSTAAEEEDEVLSIPA